VEALPAGSCRGNDTGSDGATTAGATTAATFGVWSRAEKEGLSEIGSEKVRRGGFIDVGSHVVPCL